MKKIELTLDIDAVLKGQGADPAIVISRKPGLLKIAQSALDLGLPLIHTDYFRDSFTIKSFQEESVLLEGGICLESSRIVNSFQGSEIIEVLICTIGVELENLSAKLFQSDASLALALDGLANAAVDQLMEKIYCEIESEAAEEGFNVSTPLSPGSREWPLEIGQPLLFKAIEPDPTVIKLNESFLMIPKKSTSFIVGIGKKVIKHGKTCDNCCARDNCRYKIRKNI
jgi:hypothetical protein